MDEYVNKIGLIIFFDRVDEGCPDGQALCLDGNNRLQG